MLVGAKKLLKLSAKKRQPPKKEVKGEETENPNSERRLLPEVTEPVRKPDRLL